MTMTKKLAIIGLATVVAVGIAASIFFLNNVKEVVEALEDLDYTHDDDSDEFNVGRN